MNLNDLIEKTTKQQKQDLAIFQTYFNSSGQLKQAAKPGGNEAFEFIKQVLDAFESGQKSHLSPPENKQLKAMWQILINNEKYTAALAKVILPKEGDLDQKIAAIMHFIETEESKS
ncbi:hypothetical protein NBRC116494_23890 [Aurantivibrio plasticivorans]